MTEYFYKAQYDHIYPRNWKRRHALDLYDLMQEIDPFNDYNYDFEELEKEFKEFGHIVIGDYQIKKGE